MHDHALIYYREYGEGYEPGYGPDVPLDENGFPQEPG